MTVAFLSPEVVLRLEFGKPMDIWSVGCVIVEMATGKVHILTSSSACIIPVCYYSLL